MGMLLRRIRNKEEPKQEVKKEQPKKKAKK